MLMRRPRLLLAGNTDPVFGAALRDPDGAIRAKALSCFSRILMEEEGRVSSGTAGEDLAKRSSKAEQISGDQDAESCVLGGVVQQYLAHIRKLLVDRELSVRHQAIQLAHVLLRQGMIYPPQIAPQLIALQADSDPSIRVAAMRQLMLIREKYPGTCAYACPSSPAPPSFVCAPRSPKPTSPRGAASMRNARRAA